jgi:hypothetical protein
MASQARSFKWISFILKARLVVIAPANSPAVTCLEVAQRAAHAQQNSAVAANVEGWISSGCDVESILGVKGHNSGYICPSYFRSSRTSCGK